MTKLEKLMFKQDTIQIDLSLLGQVRNLLTQIDDWFWNDVDEDKRNFQYDREEELSDWIRDVLPKINHIIYTDKNVIKRNPYSESEVN